MENQRYKDAVIALHNSDPERDYLLISHSIDRELHYKLSVLLDSRKNKKKCTLFLTTYGGDANGGYRVARCLRHHYTHIRVVIFSLCKSAGTLVAICADELAIGDLGELGPLDVQVRKDSELMERGSGLDINQALQTVTLQAQFWFQQMLVDMRELGLSTKLCAEFASSVATGLAGPLLDQIDPLRLGEMQRALGIAKEYGRRLNNHGKNLKDDALDRLVAGYPDHGFVIDRKEAKDLFHRVSLPTDQEKNLNKVIWHIVARQTEFGPFSIEPPPVEENDAEATDENKEQDGRDVNNNATSNVSAANGSGCVDGEVAANANGASVPDRKVKRRSAKA